MINPSSIATPHDSGELGRMLVAMIELLADPKAAQDRIAQYTAAHAAAVEKIAAAEREAAALRDQREFTERGLADMRRENLDRLDRARKDHEAVCAKREAELADREERLNAAEASLEARRQEVEAMRGKFERKLKALETA
jgi:hypothetical protein